MTPRTDAVRTDRRECRNSHVDMDINRKPFRNRQMYPHSHIVQIGDPILRKKSFEVPKDMINTPFVQDTIKELKTVIDKYDTVGLSAPQIGIDLRISCVQMTKVLLE